MSLKNMLKNGMVVKYRNGDNNFYTNGVFLDNIFGVCNHIGNYTDDLLYNATDNLDIVKIYKPDKVEMKLVWERQKNILTDKEKEYLSAVIKPFKSKIVYIAKVKDSNEYIRIALTDGDEMNFPYIPSGSTMYKGMELSKRYTLEELGL